MSDLTELQQAILYAKSEDPDLTNKEIAKRVGCSPSYVSTTLNDHDSWELEQISGEVTTPEEYQGEYKPPTRDQGVDWGGLIELIVAICLFLLAVGFLVNPQIF